MRSTEIIDCKKGEVYLTGDSYGMAVCVSLGQRFCPVWKKNVTVFVEMSNGRLYEATSGGPYSDEAYFVAKLEDVDFETFINKWDLTKKVAE